jgi:hypothetical protein
VNVALIMGLSKADVYETLICGLSQVNQGAFEKVKEYRDRVQDLSIKTTSSLRAQGHAGNVLIFMGIDLYCSSTMCLGCY